MAVLPRRRSILATPPWIERVAQPVAEEVEREHDDRDREPRIHREQRRREHVLLRALEHVPPRGERGLHAETEVAQRRLGEDRESHAERRRHEERWDRLRQDVACEKTLRWDAERFGRD